MRVVTSLPLWRLGWVQHTGWLLSWIRVFLLACPFRLRFRSTRAELSHNSNMDHLRGLFCHPS